MSFATSPGRGPIRSTTVLAVRRDGRTAMAGDGQVTLESTVVKQGARKVRKYNRRLERAAVELVRDWRTDRALRRLEALLLVADREQTFLLSGTGDLIEPDEGTVAIGSGSSAALAAARALVAHTELAAPDVARAALEVAAGIDIYTNDQITCEEL